MFSISLNGLGHFVLVKPELVSHFDEAGLISAPEILELVAGRLYASLSSLLLVHVFGLLLEGVVEAQYSFWCVWPSAPVLMPSNY